MAIIKIEKSIIEYNVWSGNRRTVLEYDTETYKFKFGELLGDKISNYNVELEYGNFESWEADLRGNKKAIAEYLISLGIYRINGLPGVLRKKINDIETASLMQEFISNLDELNKSDCTATRCPDDYRLNIYDSEQELVDKVESLACSCLIADKGQCNWDNIYKIKALPGYNVGPGEKDSFGWLTGVVYLPNGKCLVYG